MLDETTINEILNAPIGATIGAYPGGDDYVGFLVRDGQGDTLAVFRVPLAAAEKLADSTLPAALILGNALAPDED